MYKQKLSIGLLVCNLYAVQAYGMQLDTSLENLRDSLMDLHAALKGFPPSPLPNVQQPGVIPPAPLPGTLPPPPSPTVKPINVTLPPPPSVPLPNKLPVVLPPVPPPAPQPPAPQPPAPKPLQPVQPNIPVQPPVTPGPKPGPVCPTPAGPGALSAADLAKQKEDRERRAAAALAAGKKKQQTGRSIVESFITEPFATYPASPTVRSPIAAKDFTVEREQINGINIKQNTYLNQLKGNLFTQEDKKDRQPVAKKMLNGLLFFTKNNVIQPDQIKQIADLVVLILNIDPLLITTADAVLRQLGFTDVAVHNLMTQFFEERIRFIQETLAELKKQANEGAIQDIDEAFAYQIALSSELSRQESVLLDEHSSFGQKQEAQRFIDQVKALRKQLCDIITAPENIVLFNSKPALKALYLMICGQQQKSALKVYCVSAPYTYGKSLEGKEHTYCGFDEEIKKIMREIAEFKQLKIGEMSTSQRMYTVQTIISSLEDINTFFTNPDVCPNCLRRAIVAGHPGAVESREVEEPFKPQLADISDFLLNINKRDNSFYLENFVRNTVPKIKATLDRIRRLSNEESGIIYDLIGINRKARERGMGPYTIDDFRQGRIPQDLSSGPYF